MRYELTPCPAKFIRADQCGDWGYTQEKILAFVAEERYPPESELAVLIHELLEAYL